MPGQKASEDARRKQIMRAAFEVASRKGLAGLTVRRAQFLVKGTLPAPAL